MPKSYGYKPSGGTGGEFAAQSTLGKRASARDIAAHPAIKKPKKPVKPAGQQKPKEPFWPEASGPPEERRTGIGERVVQMVHYAHDGQTLPLGLAQEMDRDPSLKGQLISRTAAAIGSFSLDQAQREAVAQRLTSLDEEIDRVLRSA